MASSCQVQSIELACQSLDASITRYIKKLHKRGKSISGSSNKSLKEATNHFKYVVEQLVRKRTSLEFAVRAFSDVCCTGCMDALNDSIKVDKITTTSSSNSDSNNSNIINKADRVRIILCHWMRQCVRLQDCFALLQSGECRHATDVALCHSTLFKSRFGAARKRKDGYTSMYSARCYSGYGWDEIFDNDVGIIKSRIPLALGGGGESSKEPVWNAIMEHASLMDNVLTEHEESINRLFRQVENHRDKFVQSIKTLLAANNGITSVLRVSMEDKMERLDLLNAKPLYIQTLRIERHADNYQVRDPGGVLPSDATFADWKAKMIMPDLSTSLKKQHKSSSSKLKEHVLDDSEFMPRSNNNDVTTGGLKVTIRYAIEEFKQNTKTTANESVYDIKTKMGINAQSLEASREQLEMEVTTGFAENATSAERELDDKRRRDDDDQIDTDNDVAQLEEEILQRKQELIRYRQTLEVEVDEEAIWNTKDAEAEVLKTLGSLHLELFHAASNATFLQDAVKFFSDALKVIKDLEVLNNDGGDPTAVTQRTLCGLRGQVYGNLGTAYLNMAMYSKMEEENRQHYFQKANEQLSLALNSAKAMTAWCDHGKGSASFLVQQESLIHRISALGLESFANKVLGVVLWKMGDYKKAAKALHDASADRWFSNGALTNNRAHESKVRFLVQRCEAAVQFALLAAEEAGKSFVSLTRMAPVQRRNEGDEFISVAIRAYRRGVILVREINESITKSELEIFEENCIPTEEELCERIKALEERRKQLKTLDGVPLQKTVIDKHAKLNRNDLQTTNLLTAHCLAPPTAMFTFTPRITGKNAKRAKKLNAPLQDPFLDTGTDSRFHEGATSHAQEKSQYRKWGDQLLPQSPGGSVIYEYPGCCPPLPPELQMSNLNSVHKT